MNPVSGSSPDSTDDTLAGASVARTMRALAHLPHCGHAPILADIRFLRDALGFSRDVYGRCGPVSRGVLFARPQVLLMSAQAIEGVLFDRDGTFSAKAGWGPLLGRLFPGGLIVRDGEDHRRHRRLMLPALRREELAKHTARMAPAIDAAVDGWIEMHRELKRLTLSLAIDVFLGVRLREEIDALHRDLDAIVEAAAAIVRLPVPGTVWTRGLAARRRAAAFLHTQIAQRRRTPGEDLFSQLCVQAGGRPDSPRTDDPESATARTRSGPAGGFTDQELVDHMIFLLMAAHDTTTSALTTTVMSLALHPQWQEHLRDEVRVQAGSAGRDASQAADIDQLGRLDLTWQTLREALRMYPPIPTIARATTRAVELHGQRIPAGTQVTVFPLLVQRDPQWWTDPDRFDPERFGPARAEHKRHPCAWTPFGGGAHMCLGMNFAELQAKIVLRTMLARSRWQIAPGYRHDYAFAPIGKPRHGLPITLHRP